MKQYPKPRNTLILVRELDRSEEVVGGIIMPAYNSQNFMRAQILAVGPGMATNSRDETEMHDLKAGQIVWIKSHTVRGPNQRTPNGQELTFDGEKLWLFEQTEAMVILSEPGESLPARQTSVMVDSPLE